MGSLKKLSRRQFVKGGFYSMAALGACKSFYNTTSYHIELTDNQIIIPHLPPSFKNFKIAQLTDLHSSMVVSQNLIKHAADMAIQEKPDVIFLTGDFISGATKFGSGSIGKFDKTYVDLLVKSLSKLKAPHGIFAVLGNHDFWSGPEAVNTIMTELTKQLGIKWLRNSNAQIRRGKEKIDILGVDDYWESTCSIFRACKGLDDKTVRILMSHNPDINEMIDAQNKRIDLIVSGHTHGGQVVMPFVGAPYIPSGFGQHYRAGLVKDLNRQTYISRGVGHFLVPIRINCPPEVAVLRLV